MAFRDDYPQDPPPIGDNWASPIDRRQHDSLEEVRVALRELGGLLDGLSRQEIELHDGRRLDILARDAGVAGGVGRWDLIASGSGYILRDPLLLARYGSMQVIRITNEPISVAAGQWVVLRLDSVTADPYTFTLDTVAAESDQSLKVYLFNGDGDLSDVRLPVHYLSGDEIAGAAVVDEVWALKYISDTIQTLASHHVIVPGEPISRAAPRLVSL